MADQPPVVMYSPTGSKVLVEAHQKESLMKQGWRLGRARIGSPGSTSSPAAKADQAVTGD